MFLSGFFVLDIYLFGLIEGLNCSTWYFSLWPADLVAVCRISVALQPGNISSLTLLRTPLGLPRPWVQQGVSLAQEPGEEDHGVFARCPDASSGFHHRKPPPAPDAGREERARPAFAP